MTTRKSNATRRDLALAEIESVAVNMIADLKILATSVEVILAEAREARKGS